MAGTFAFREMFRAITRLDWVLRVVQDDEMEMPACHPGLVPGRA